MEKRERTLEVYNYVAGKLAQSGLVEGYGNNNQSVVLQWTPKGAEFREKFSDCLGQLNFEPTAEELAVLMAIISGMESA